MDVLYFEHFGAKVLQDPNGLSDPINGKNDSTVPIQKLFKSLQGRIWPTELAAQPGAHNSFTVRLLGIYGISDEIKVNPGGYRICGSGIGLLRVVRASFKTMPDSVRHQHHSARRRCQSVRPGRQSLWSKLQN